MKESKKRQDAKALVCVVILTAAFEWFALFPRNLLQLLFCSI